MGSKPSKQSNADKSKSAASASASASASAEDRNKTPPQSDSQQVSSPGVSSPSSIGGYEQAGSVESDSQKNVEWDSSPYVYNRHLAADRKHSERTRAASNPQPANNAGSGSESDAESEASMVDSEVDSTTNSSQQRRYSVPTSPPKKVKNKNSSRKRSRRRKLTLRFDPANADQKSDDEAFHMLLWSCAGHILPSQLANLWDENREFRNRHLTEDEAKEFLKQWVKLYTEVVEEAIHYAFDAVEHDSYNAVQRKLGELRSTTITRLDNISTAFDAAMAEWDDDMWDLVTTVIYSNVILTNDQNLFNRRAFVTAGSKWTRRALVSHIKPQLVKLAGLVKQEMDNIQTVQNVQRRLVAARRNSQ
jgi:hypothetical protein